MDICPSPSHTPLHLSPSLSFFFFFYLTIDLDAFKNLLSTKTKVVSIAHVSNVLGIINPIKEITRLAHQYGAIVVVDGAQSVPHMAIDVQELDCDFLAFSGHKLYGPTGIGVLYGKKKWLNQLPPYQGGGEMIDHVRWNGTTYNELPYKFEAGTPNYIGSYALGKAIDYINEIGWETIETHEAEITAYCEAQLAAIEGIHIYAANQPKAGAISFNIYTNGQLIHPFDIGTLLDHQGIAIRTGHHCAQPLIEELGVPGTARVSFGLYNEKEDIDIFITALTDVKFDTISNYFVPFARYIRNPMGTNTVLAMNEKHISTAYNIPQNLWFIVNIDEFETLDNMPEYISDIATVNSFEFELCEPERTHTEITLFKYPQFDFLDTKNKSIAEIDEDTWKKLDKLEEYVNAQSPYSTGNKLWTSLEKYVATYIACEGDKREALDKAIAVKMIPSILSALKDCEIEEDKDLSSTLNRLFGEDNTIFCHKIMEIAMSVPEYTEEEYYNEEYYSDEYVEGEENYEDIPEGEEAYEDLPEGEVAYEDIPEDAEAYADIPEGEENYEDISDDEETYEDVAEDVVEDVEEDVVEDVVEDVAEEIVEDVVEDAAEEIVEDVVEDAAEDIVEDVVEDAAEEIAEDVIEDAAEEIVEDVIEDAAEEIVEDVVEDTAEEVVDDEADEKPVE